MEERQYFQMVQQSTEKVSPIWKVYHVVTLMTAAISGLVTEIYFCRILYGFSNNCVLSAKISFRAISPNETIISTTETKWNSDNLCQFCSTMWITSFLIGVVLSVFFMACSREARATRTTCNRSSSNTGDRSQFWGIFRFTRPWKLICPVFFISVLMLINMSVATGMTISGLRKFCAEFEPELKTKKCTSAIDTYTIEFTNKKYAIATSINIVNKTAILTLFAWILFTLLTLLRICFAPDFALLLITVKKANYKKYTEV